VPHTLQALDHRRRGDLLLQISKRLGKRLALLSIVRSKAVRSQSKLIQQGICRNWMRQKTGDVMSGWRPFGNVIVDDVWA
jgi:hypothetical protein